MDANVYSVQMQKKKHSKFFDSNKFMFIAINVEGRCRERRIFKPTSHNTTLGKNNTEMINIMLKKRINLAPIHTHTLYSSLNILI